MAKKKHKGGGANRSFKIAGIENLCRTNYGVDPSLLDLESLVDDSLSMPENWANVKEKVLYMCEKPYKMMFEYYR